MVIQNFELELTLKNIEIPYLLLSFSHRPPIWIFYIVFDNITFAQNVTASNLSYLLYITYFGESDV